MASSYCLRPVYFSIRLIVAPQSSGAETRQPATNKTTVSNAAQVLIQPFIDKVYVMFFSLSSGHSAYAYYVPPFLTPQNPHATFDILRATLIFSWPQEKL